MSRKKRVSWFFESQPESKEEQNQSSLQMNTVEEQKQDQKMPSALITQPMQVVAQAPQTIQTPQFEMESNRTRKVSFIPFIGNRVAESTPPKLSTIFEEQPSSKKQEPQQNKVPVAQQIQIQQSIQKQPTINTQIIQTPQQQPYRTPKAIQIEENSGKQSYRKNVKPIEIDIVKELQQLNQLAEMNEATLKRVITREEQEILIIQDLLTQKISKLQQKLIQLNEIEQKQLDSKMNNNSKLNQQQERESLIENQLDEPKKQDQKGSSQQIRGILIQCLGYKVSHIYYDKKQYQITFTYKQANVQYTFQNQKQIDANLEIQEIFNEFYRELQENRLVLSGLKVDYKQKTEINKGEILQLSLKHQFQNSNKMANEIIFSAIHQMPILLQQIREYNTNQFQQLIILDNQIQQVYLKQMNQNNNYFLIIKFGELYGNQIQREDLFKFYLVIDVEQMTKIYNLIQKRKLQDLKQIQELSKFNINFTNILMKQYLHLFKKTLRGKKVFQKFHLVRELKVQ